MINSVLRDAECIVVSQIPAVQALSRSEKHKEFVYEVRGYLTLLNISWEVVAIQSDFSKWLELKLMINFLSFA